MNWRPNFILNIFFCLFVGIFLGAPLFASAAGASIYLSPASGTYTQGSEFSVKVMLDPVGNKVNVAEAEITFDNTVLSVVRLTKDGSSLSLWASEPAFSNAKGTINFGGGATTPFSGKATILTVFFKGLKAGTANVAVAKGSVLAADGKGTEVLEGKVGAVITISQAATTASPTPRPSVPLGTPVYAGTGDLPLAPKITCSTHPDSEKWYKTATADCSWDIASDVTAVRLLLSKEKDADPNVVYVPPINSKKLEDIKDGEWYFSLQLKNYQGWGEKSVKKIMVDTGLPLEYEIKLLDQGVHSSAPKLFFETQDQLSGIDYYEVKIGQVSPVKVYPKDFVSGAYPLAPGAGGQEEVVVKAYDKAGNVRESKANLLIPAVAERGSAEEEPPQEKVSFFTAERIVWLFFVFLSGILAAAVFIQKYKRTKEIKVLMDEINGLRTKTDQIFMAMREEIDEQVNAFDKRPQLTPEERSLLEKLKEVLDLSEELIDMEIDDIKKILRK